MALDPDTNPRAFLITFVAAGLLLWGKTNLSPKELFEAAETFVIEAERRYGPLKL